MKKELVALGYSPHLCDLEESNSFFDCVLVCTVGEGNLLAFGFAPSDDRKSSWLFLKFGGTGNRILIQNKNIIGCYPMRVVEAKN